MRFVWACATKDLRRQIADPFAMAIWLGIPIILGGLIVLAFGGEDTTPRAQVLIADEDSSFVSQLFTGALQRFPVIVTEPSSRDAGHARVEQGRATALLVIPSGFGRAVMDGDSVTLPLLTNPSQRILPAIAEESIGALTDVTFYVQQLLGPLLAEAPADVRSGDAAPSSEFVARTSVRMNELITHLRPYLLPPVVSVETGGEQPAPEIPGGLGALFFPGILLMSLLFASQGMSADLWEEIQSGTLRRTAGTPHGVGALLGGKLLAGVIIMTVVCAIAVAIGVRFFEVPLAWLPLAVAWGSLTGGTFLCLFLFLQTLASARRGANMLISLILFPLLMVGGSFFPFEALPAWLAAIGRWTPNGWAVLQLQSILRGQANFASLASSAMVFAAAAAALLAWTTARTRRRFVRS